MTTDPQKPSRKKIRVWPVALTLLLIVFAGWISHEKILNIMQEKAVQDKADKFYRDAYEDCLKAHDRPCFT